MRYLRMLSNSVCGGLLASVYVTAVFLHLNPGVPLGPAAIASLAGVVVLSYGIAAAAALNALYVLRQIVVLEPSSPGWVSLRLLTWSAALISGGIAVVAWLNARAFGNALEPQAVTTLRRAAAAAAVSVGVFVVLGITHSVGSRRRRPIVATLFLLATGCSMVAPYILRGSAVERSNVRSPPRVVEGALAGATESPRIFMLNLDGASLDVISPAVAEGRLPNFSRLLDRGASMHLATARPTQPEPVWASVATGKWPSKHGIRGPVLYHPLGGWVTLELLPDYLFAQALVRLGLLTEEAHSASTSPVWPIWRILDGYGLSTGTIGLPLTHPAETIRGFIVSDRFHRRLDRAVNGEASSAVYPPGIDGLAFNSADFDLAAALPAAVTDGGAPNSAESVAAVADDAVHHRLAMHLTRAFDVHVLAVRYAGLDAVGHLYLRYAMPGQFGDVSEDERRRFGRVLGDYYAYLDGLVGEVVAELREGDLLLVVSGFGMEALTPGKRLLERLSGNERLSGTHERAPDGFLLAYGSSVTPGRLLRGAIVDVAPTLLYFLGLPVARDMDGHARTDVFSTAFNSQRTITFIPTYDR